MLVTHEIKLTEADDSMCIAKDVLDEKGNRLVTAGTLLKTAVINLLHKRGVKTIFIEREELKTTEQLESLRLRFEEDTAKLFRKVSPDSFMLPLKNILIEYQLSKVK